MTVKEFLQTNASRCNVRIYLSEFPNMEALMSPPVRLSAAATWMRFCTKASARGESSARIRAASADSVLRSSIEFLEPLKLIYP